MSLQLYSTETTHRMVFETPLIDEIGGQVEGADVAFNIRFVRQRLNIADRLDVRAQLLKVETHQRQALVAAFSTRLRVAASFLLAIIILT